jgi:hypothetical protein
VKKLDVKKLEQDKQRQEQVRL